MTTATLAVLDCLLTDDDTPRYGLSIARAIGLPTGTVVPILARLEGEGWADSDWEDVDPSAAKRPRRRHYRLSPEGRRQATRALAVAAERHARLAARLGSWTGEGAPA